jgi:pyruvate/2-oxoglutarate dehydrogenase complex dihydrolipoamide acyltransferase (E2) component
MFSAFGRRAFAAAVLVRPTSATAVSMTRSLASFRATVALYKTVVQNVPPLGESITEGTISKWLKKEGDHVDADEVVCIVETDKVTVDLKSEYTGKFVKQIAQDEVKVDNPLFEIDVDDKGGSSGSSSEKKSEKKQSSSKEPAPKKEEPKENKSSEKAQATHKEDKSHDKTHGERTPSIKFLGKRSLLSKDQLDELHHQHHKPSSESSKAPQQQSQQQKSQQQPTTSKPKKQGNGIPFTDLRGGAFYGRPVISDKEAEAILSGGASLCSK